MMAREDALGDVVNRKLRPLLTNKKGFNCTDVKIRDSATSYGAANNQSAPRRRGPTEILDSDETGATVKFQSQTFKVARFCLRKTREPQAAGDLNRNPAPGTSDTRDEAPSADLGETRKMLDYLRKCKEISRREALPRPKSASAAKICVVHRHPC